jgi:hypothetical protein
MNKHHKRMLTDSLEEIYNLNTGTNMDDKLQKMCNYLRKAKANKTETLEKEGGLISNANAKMDNPITSAISSAASTVGNWFSGDGSSISSSVTNAGAAGGVPQSEMASSNREAFRKSKKILEKAKNMTPEDVMKQYNAPKIKTKTAQNVMTYQDKEPKENVLKYDEINKIKTKPSTSGINYQELKAPIDNEPNWKKKLKITKSEEDNDSHMADSDLNSVNHHSQEIKQNLDPNKDLPDWVDSKINTSANEMSDVAHYLESNPQDSKKQMTEVLKKCKMKMAKAWKPFMD